ncbi:MAG: N-acetyl sugar amidotransferase [Bermanella sp.]
MDTTDPEITFDEKGQCNHCRDAEIKLSKAWLPDERGAQKLKAIATEIKANQGDKEYDSIIGVSGGVDSSYLLHVAKVDMGLNPLVVHVDAGWNSEVAVNNIEKMVKQLGLDLFTYVVDWEEMKDLQLAYLKSSLANQDVPQDHSFFAKLYEFADKNAIKYAITGSNLTSESILPNAWGYDASDSIQIKAIHKKYGKRKLKSYPLMSFFSYKIFWPYFKKMVRVAPLNYMDYDKNKAIQFLQDEYGWVYYGGKHHESKWTKFFQAYYLPVKFGYDKRKAHLSSLIVSGQVTREAALRELEQPLYNDQELEEDKRFIAKKLGLELRDFNALLELPNKEYSDYPNQEKILKAFRLLKSRIVSK